MRFGENGRMTRRRAAITGAALLVVAGVLGVFAVALLHGTVNPVDEAWNRLMVQGRQPLVLDAARVLDAIGGGVIAVFVIPPAIALTLLALRRWREALFSIAAFAGSALFVQLLKQLFGRDRPADLLVASDYGSFPSGHTANAATIAIVLWLVLPRAWVAIAGGAWTVLMALSRTALSVHWLTDTIGGALAGAAAGLLVAAVLWRWLRWEHRPSSKENAMSVIRPYRPADREALYDVCARTADAGGDATGILTDDRLWGDVWSVPYAERDPGLCWVVESEDGRVIGYIVATDDTDAFETWFRDAWWPGRAGEYPAETPDNDRQTGVIRYASNRGPGKEAVATEYPAHLHIDLLPETQGQGLGRRLVDTLFAELRRRGVRGLHLGTSLENPGAMAFYQRIGFDRLDGPEGSVLFGVRWGS